LKKGDFLDIILKINVKDKIIYADMFPYGLQITFLYIFEEG